MDAYLCDYCGAVIHGRRWVDVRVIERGDHSERENLAFCDYAHLALWASARAKVPSG